MKTPPARPKRSAMRLPAAEEVAMARKPRTIRKRPNLTFMGLLGMKGTYKVRAVASLPIQTLKSGVIDANLRKNYFDVFNVEPIGLLDCDSSPGGVCVV